MPAPYCYDYPRPMVAVDLAVFAWTGDGLRVLLVRRRNEPFAGSWALPGGYLGMDESPEEGARRELREETGLVLPGPVEPLGFFGDPGRDPRGRTISLVHAAVVGPGDHPIEGSDDAAEAAWKPADADLRLAFDHAKILRAAGRWLMDGLRDGGLAKALFAGEPPQDSLVAIRRAIGSLEANPSAS
ncbi:Bifunctional NMN adenylyltransferase/Nudix hydrolase [Aquisphaera giovannonii]|uniref:Bifunctional NMN adenylyltransferase/Nudix hydrolase n=1 Tax=Aquisphaera giovannonii TaxID=406548 RepID=A0A5B9W990_9BACT|nr:NUDIX hydrolase [Aquisphaera giovannonii]QEH37113.1 Bifunctional NMN adenylyltransferase/Nudix hydrolase [Aquisphaera giovannonii]